MKKNKGDALSENDTVIPFKPSLPLLRIPVKLSEEEEPEITLAFRDEDSKFSSWQACKSRFSQQCETGAKMGCAIGASQKCKLPWWRVLFGVGKITAAQIAEREACEEREMQACVIASQNKCSEYAKNTCDSGFSSAIVADKSSSQTVNRKPTFFNFRRAN